jgi:hypothetical protein
MTGSRIRGVLWISSCGGRGFSPAALEQLSSLVSNWSRLLSLEVWNNAERKFGQLVKGVLLFAWM